MALTGVVGQESTHCAQWMQRSLWMTIWKRFSSLDSSVISMASAGQSRSQARQAMHRSGWRKGEPRKSGGRVSFSKG